MSRAMEAPADRAKRFVEIHSHEPNLILDPVPMAGVVDRLAGDDDFTFGDLRALLTERAELLKDWERLKRIQKLVYGAFGKESIDAALEVDAYDAATPPKSEAAK